MVGLVPDEAGHLRLDSQLLECQCKTLASGLRNPTSSDTMITSSSAVSPTRQSFDTACWVFRVMIPQLLLLTLERREGFMETLHGMEYFGEMPANARPVR